MVDNHVYRSYINAFQACCYSHAHLEDFYTDLEAESKDSNDDGSEERAVNEHPLADFEAFVHQRPQEDLIQVDLLNGLGTQDIDQNYDQSVHVGCYDVSPNVWDQVKARYLIAQVVVVDSSQDPLNLEQRKLYNMVMDQYS